MANRNNLDHWHKRIVQGKSPEQIRQEKKRANMERAILEAAERNDNRLQDLLQVAIETMDEEQANRLLDKVHQIQSENLREIRGWKGEPAGDDSIPDNPLDEDWVQPDDA